MPRLAFKSLCCLAVTLAPQVRAQPAAPPRQTEADAYTRYELLAPGSGKFRIIYDVTATTPGATYYFNSIRVTLARPVPADGGEVRLLIDKTHEDAQRYFVDGDAIVFNRALGIKRNAVVLPRGYELVSCNYPSQTLQESDGRIAISFWNATPAEAPSMLRAKAAAKLTVAQSTVASKPDERAKRARDIVYYLQQPEAHAFDLYHDDTESKAGVDFYVNVVRAGSTVSKPSARNLDTGDPIRFELLKGAAITKASPGVADVTPATETVVFRFPPVPQGGSARMRM